MIGPKSLPHRYLRRRLKALLKRTSSAEVFKQQHEAWDAVLQRSEDRLRVAQDELRSAQEFATTVQDRYEQANPADD